MNIHKLAFLFLLSLIFFPLTAQEVEHLGPEINSEYEEREPTLSADGKTLYFWRRQMPGNTGGLADPGDAWYSTLQADGSFSQARRMPPPINTMNQDFIWQESKDGDTLFMSQFRPGYPDRGFKYAIKRGDMRWRNPRDMYVQSVVFRGRSKAFHITPQGYLLLVNQTSGSVSGPDIFISFPVNDSIFSKPVPLGFDVNTAGDEDAPFMLSDGKTLFFNSNGHGADQQHDVYYSTRLDDSWQRWSKPQPVGAPVNTPGYEFDLVFDQQEEYMYWGSDYQSFGSNDLYRMKVSDCAARTYPEGDQAMCEGEKIELEAGFALGDNTYQWKRDGIDIPGATGRTLEVSTTGSYQVERKSAGCTTLSKPQQITFIPKPRARLAADQTFICEEDSIVIGTNSEQASSWEWYKNGLRIPGANNPELWVKRPGWYWVKVSNGACDAVSDRVRVGRMAKPEIFPADQASARARARAYKWLWTSEFSHKKEGLILKDISGDPVGNSAVLGLRKKGRNYLESLLVFDRNGNIKWTQEGGTSSDPSDRFVELDYEGSVLVSSKDQFLKKYSSKGNLLWEKDGPHEKITGLTSDPLGHVYVMGQYQDSLELGGRIYAPKKRGGVFLVKYDPWGKFQWARTFSAETYKHDFGNALQCDESGNIFVAGGFEFIAGFERNKVLQGTIRAQNYFLAKYRPNGDLEWVRKYAVDRTSYHTCDMHTDPDGNTYLLLNYKIIKYDPQGRITWRTNLQTPGSMHPKRARIAVDGQGTLFTLMLMQEKNAYLLSRTSRRGEAMMVWQQNNLSKHDANLPVICANNAGFIYLSGLANGKSPSREGINRTPAFISSFGSPEPENTLDPLSICPGETVALQARLPKGLAFYWMKDGAPLSGASDTILLVAEKGKYQIRAFSGDCIRFSNVQEVNQCYQASSAPKQEATLAVAPPPLGKQNPPEPPPTPEPEPVKVEPKPEPVDPTPEPEPVSLVPNKLERDRAGAPSRLNNRKVSSQGKVNIKSTKVKIQVWDHGAVDNDTISLNFNGKWLVEEYALKKKPLEFEIELDPNGKNFIILYAHNLGTVPPNTASLKIDDGIEPQELKLRSNLNSCGSVDLNLR